MSTPVPSNGFLNTTLSCVIKATSATFDTLETMLTYRQVSSNQSPDGVNPTCDDVFNQIDVRRSRRWTGFSPGSRQSTSFSTRPSIGKSGIGRGRARSTDPPPRPYTYLPPREAHGSVPDGAVLFPHA